MSSQSGTTRQILECAKILRDRNQYIVTITADPASPLARMSDEVISVRIGEDDSFAVKLESFASFNAIHFALDCLYCFLFRRNFDRTQWRTGNVQNLSIRRKIPSSPGIDHLPARMQFQSFDNTALWNTDSVSVIRQKEKPGIPRFRFTLSNDYSASLIAPTGHVPTQERQEMHVSALHSDLPSSSSERAVTGHTPTHAPQPMQFSLSTTTAIISVPPAHDYSIRIFAVQCGNA